MGDEENDWLDQERDVTEDDQIDEYDLTSTPNDFNISTIFSFISSGAVKIPGFQRHYVWDKKRASKLIESLIIGLPVPQVFLYEEARNSFLVIDGQQRLMSIYYFIKQRFPKKGRRAEVRSIFNESGQIPDDILSDNDLFDDFSLQLPEVGDGQRNKFHGLNYATLGEHRVQFDLRTIRNVIVKQIKPSGDDSSIYEMFGRLNSGGINLTPQEIRLSLYHSKFYDLLFRLNLNGKWRRLLDQPESDVHMRDIEVLLRAIAVWQEGLNYKPSMVRFLNRFSRDAQKLDDAKLNEIESTFEWFINATEDLDPNSLRRQSKFSGPLFEAIFAASCSLKDEGVAPTLTSATVTAVKSDAHFKNYTQSKTTATTSVLGRRKRAIEIIRDFPAGDSR